MSNLKSSEYGLPWHPEMFVLNTNIEITNTIIESVGRLGLYSIDALTDLGWLRMLGIECAEHQRDVIVRRLCELLEQWASPRTTVLFGVPSVGISLMPPAPVLESVASHQAPELTNRTANEWVFSSEEILAKLESQATTREDRMTAVLFAETMAFSEMQKPRLLRALFDICELNRFSTDDELTTVVGSAIRKYAMNMPTSEFETYSRLFERTATETLSCEIELELAKAVGWRLGKLKKVDAGEFPNLEARLSELASDYLVPRILLQKNFASIVIHAVIGVCLLRGSQQDELIDKIARLDLEWFSDLFARRLLDVVRKRSAILSKDDDTLTRLHERLLIARH